METPAYSSPAHLGQESRRHLQALPCWVKIRPTALKQKLHESSFPVLKPSQAPELLETERLNENIKCKDSLQEYQPEEKK